MRTLKILASIILVVLFINLYLTFDINNKFNSITGQAVTEQESKLEAGNPIKGSKDAPVTIVEFSDFQCPFCAKFFEQALPKIEEKYIRTGKAKIVFKQFPLNFHQYAEKAAEASECANEQGKFWGYHDLLFKNQNALNITSLKQYARTLNLDSSKFDTCLDSGKYYNKVQKDVSDGLSSGVSGTPSFLINNIKLVGAQPYEAFEQIIEQELNK